MFSLYFFHVIHHGGMTMVTAVSTTTTTTTASVSTSSTSTTVAQLKAELTAKQAELESAKTDEDKASINKEISTLKASIAKAEGQSAGNSSQAASSNRGPAKPATVAVTSADRAAPESKVSSAAMDVLMTMGAPGGERPEGAAPDFSKLYDDLDADDDGVLTKSEFVSGSVNRMSEQQAGALFDAMDEEDTGKLSEDQFSEGMLRAGPGGRPPMGPPPGGSTESATTTKATAE